MPATSARAFGQNLRALKDAGEWVLPYMGAAALSAPAYAIGAVKYGAPELAKGYRQGGVVGALGGLNEAARKVPIIGGPSVALMDAATRFAEQQGASGPAMFAADLASPDPMGKLGALATAAKGIGGLNVAGLSAYAPSLSRRGGRATAPGGPARVATWTPEEVAQETRMQIGIGALSENSELAGQANQIPGVVHIAPDMPPPIRRDVVFHEQAHDAMRRIPKEVRDAYYKWINGEPSWSPYRRALLGVRPDDPLSVGGINVDEYVADAYSYIDPYTSATLDVEIDPEIGTGMERVAIPKPLRDVLFAIDDELGGMWKRRSERASQRLK